MVANGKISNKRLLVRRKRTENETVAMEFLQIAPQIMIVLNILVRVG